ncbi:hypothetical protein ACFRAM_23185 [Paenibacillus sp. NPDC056722]|uniref:hypothetical protein n=1 Tax=Paenibacillus sp. NPDC056722 TaxID=3345924 RepID=UPI0036B072C0
MSAPLPAKSARRSLPAFRGLVEQYADSVYTLCILLLKDPQLAEQAAVHTFTALGRSSRLTPGSSLPGSIQVYQTCLSQCSLTPAARLAGEPGQPAGNRLVLSALRYGLGLPLADISTILHLPVPELKIQLRALREDMRTAHDSSSLLA